MSNNLQMPFQDIVGEDSPVQQALRHLRILADEKPMPNANSDQSRSASALILTHLLGLCDSTGLINCRGYHSAAITMFRPIEDATDCFAAVALDINAAKNWAEGNLKSSDAAKIWTNAVNLVMSDGIYLSEYRKIIRHALNNYSHCTPEQAKWNVYLEFIDEKKCAMELNTKSLVINLNAYYIDRYLCTHLYELIEIVLIAFSEYFEAHHSLKERLGGLRIEIEKIVVDFLGFIKSKKIDVSIAPEIGRLSNCEEIL
ncbi:hypothetical protein Dtox_3886 [Desulfofarcimen acetoxidans DSM 771]|uniref:Uncharacterized protein n=1 Tax=Desulfofarcimen acetoxidans (strain ATCC 49208 / DSM 771 / KCTC 5769 / VKM B-1644 / 5575) TaxID=485916 RepID=C8VXI4_DESAS|nr:hypothetical protein [Desulfofarcimen acetoxidans]ACV64580.1 hypothetical protein Dtox_3886 [Desulfofarcimen acetoxidans DSM 771]